MRKELDLKLRLHTIKRHDTSEGWEFARPYLWTIFFKIDGSCITITDNFRLEGKAKFHFGPGSHGNLGITKLDGKSTIRIPSKVGEWNTRLTPLIVPHFESKTNAVAGIITVLMEKNNVSKAGAEAGHQTLNRKVEEKLNSLIAGFDPRKLDLDNLEASIFDYFKSESGSYASEIKEAVTDAVKNNQSLVRNIMSLVSADNMIGYEIWNFSLDEIANKEGHINFSKRWTDSRLGDWEIFGEAGEMV
ncbi:MAG: hypothetical protein AAF502_01300 [Bacteroidota bacterium]